MIFQWNFQGNDTNGSFSLKVVDLGFCHIAPTVCSFILLLVSFLLCSSLMCEGSSSNYSTRKTVYTFQSPIYICILLSLTCASVFPVDLFIYLKTGSCNVALLAWNLQCRSCFLPLLLACYGLKLCATMPGPFL